MYVFRLRFVVMCLILVSSFTRGGASQEEVIAYLHYNGKLLCPNASICGKTSVSEQSKKCCSDCSCAEDCVVNGNCCFPGNVSYPLAEMTTCEYMTTIEYPTPKMLTVNMISKCPKRDDLQQIGNQLQSNRVSFEENCGNIAVTPWGGLFPVFSRSTGQIYKNIRCAECHGALEATTDAFDIRFLCVLANYDQYFLALEANSVHKHCHIQVNIQKPFLRDILEHRCYKHIVNKCPEFDFDIPRHINMTNTQIINSCIGGLYAPYISSVFKHKYPFANIFCFFCNNRAGSTSLMQSCKSWNVNEVPNKAGNYPLTVLLNRVFDYSIHYRQAPFREGGECATMQWSTNDEDSCRLLRCPTGQIRESKHGQCSHGLKVVARDYAITLYFTVKGTLTPDERRVLTDREQFETVMKRPLRKLWLIYMLYYTDEDDGQDMLLFVALRAKENYIQLNDVLKIAKGLMTGLWKLSFQNRTIEMIPQLYTGRFECQNLSAHPIRYFISKSPNVTFHQVYKGLFLSTVSILVTKMFFCHQVELRPEEYVISVSKCELKLTFTNNTLHSNEFVLYKTADGNQFVRVCAEDVAVIQNNRATSGSPSSTIMAVFGFLMTVLVL